MTRKQQALVKAAKVNHYARLKPTSTELRRDGIKVIINNGKVLTYCNECYSKIKSKELKEKK